MTCPACGATRWTRIRFLPAGHPTVIMMLCRCDGCGLHGFSPPTGTPAARVAPPRPVPAPLVRWALSGDHRLVVPSGVDLTTAAPGIVAALSDDGGGREGVAYWLSLEERVDPVAELRAAAARLSPGGAILITADDAGSPGARLFGGRWSGWEPGRQRWVFSAATLRGIIGRAGLDVGYLQRVVLHGLVTARAELR